jgi:hypothetical protein
MIASSSISRGVVAVVRRVWLHARRVAIVAAMAAPIAPIVRTVRLAVVVSGVRLAVVASGVRAAVAVLPDIRLSVVLLVA